MIPLSEGKKIFSENSNNAKKKKNYFSKYEFLHLNEKLWFNKRNLV